MKLSLLAGVAAAALTAATAAQASHYRGGAIIPTIDASGVLTIEASTFWRPTFVGAATTVTITRGGAGVGSLNYTTNVQDTSDTRFTRVDQTGTFDLTGQAAGLYTLTWSSNARVSGILNASESTFGSTSTIYWDGVNATNPITFDIQNIQPNVVRGTAYSDNLDVTSANGDSLSYDDTVLLPSMSSQAPGYAISATGQITIDAASTAAYPDNPSNDGADVAFSGQINASSGGAATGSVQFDWLFDAVDTGANTVPDLTDVIINATVGATINTTITGTDPNGDDVTLSLLSFNGPGGAIGGSSFDPGTPGSPVTGTFTWDSAGFAPGTYIATIFGTDGTLSDQGTITINLSAPSDVPLPAAGLMLGAALAGFGVMRRRAKA